MRVKEIEFEATLVAPCHEEDEEEGVGVFFHVMHQYRSQVQVYFFLNRMLSFFSLPSTPTLSIPMKHARIK
jgi:hypothetical protein